MFTGIKRITYRVHERTAGNWENFWVALGGVLDQSRSSSHHRSLNLGTFEIVLKPMISASPTDDLAVHGDPSAIKVSIGVDAGSQHFVAGYVEGRDTGVLNFILDEKIPSSQQDALWTPPWLKQADHITIVERENTIEAKAELLVGLGGRLRKQILDVRQNDPLDSMQLWEIIFNEDRPAGEQFFIALVAGIDRQEQSQVSMFEQRRGPGMLQHVAYNVGEMDAFRFFFEETLGGNLLSETLEVPDSSGSGLTEQVFTYGFDVALSVAESEFIEIISRTKQGSQGVGVKEQAGVDLYNVVREISKSNMRRPIVDFPQIGAYLELTRRLKTTSTT